ncbi:hypothetical protein [Streptomyces sp. NPDC048473]|uniref:hypothetical protein n=1 Tax=unclassified Streptomyces TaxID=2593676 RepID=UPI00371B65A3
MFPAQLIGTIVGVVLGCASIVLARRVRGENWLYSASLILLPLIYSGFALAAGEGQVALREMLVGTPFIVGGVICLVFGIPLSALIVGTLWILHAVFDLIHDALFVNTGVPGWYPVFCAAIDLVVGAYILRLARRLPRAAFRQASRANVGPGTQSQ